MKKSLGRGLGALIPGYDAETSGPLDEQEIKLIDIEPNRDQPRKSFDPEPLESLAESIRQHGIIQPILVQRQDNGRYTIIAGERRWRAARMAGLKTIPAVVRNTDTSNIMELALIENLQREDLNPLDEAEGYRFLSSEYGLTREQISQRIGKSQSAISNALRLLTLPEQILDMLKNGSITGGHAKMLVSMEDKEWQLELAQKIVTEGLSVREVERLAKRPRVTFVVREQRTDEKHVYIRNIQDDMCRLLGTKVKINTGKRKNKIEIEYYSDEDLDRILNIWKS